MESVGNRPNHRNPARRSTPADLRLLLTEYGVGGEPRDALLAIARPQGAQGWRRSYGTVPAACRDLFPLEAAATQILIWEPQRVPDLLQTPGGTRGHSPPCYFRVNRNVAAGSTSSSNWSATSIAFQIASRNFHWVSYWAE